MLKTCIRPFYNFPGFMLKKFRANFDSFCEILDHLEQFWSSDHYGAGLLQISREKISPESGNVRVNFHIVCSKLSSKAIHTS